MDLVGAICEREWTSFNGLCSEEADFMAQLLGNCSFSNEIPGGFPAPAHDSIAKLDKVDESSRCSAEEYNNTISLPQGRISNHEGYGANFFLAPRCGSFYGYPPHQSTSDSFMTMDYSVMERKRDSSRGCFLTNDAVEGDELLDRDISNDSFMSDEMLADNVLEGQTLQLGIMPNLEPIPSQFPLKRSLIHGEEQETSRSVKLKRYHSLDHKVFENNNAALFKQRSRSWCSDDELNASFNLNKGVSTSSMYQADKLNVKVRASRGSATDPQSIYARKRRERINERLKILQNLIPNGTKVDISTMLEEAVQYVKFLQVQIKLLSSDDLWMYAPIAYNGMDIGLDIKIPSSPKLNSQS